MLQRKYIFRGVLTLTIIALLVVILRRIDPDAMRLAGASILKFSPSILLICLVLALGQNLCSIQRLRSLIPPSLQIPWWNLAHAISFGQFVNAFLPARAGDVLKVVLMNRDPSGRVSITSGASSVVADKIADILALLLLIALTGLYQHPIVKRSFSPSILIYVGVGMIVVWIPSWIFIRSRKEIPKWWIELSDGFSTLIRFRHLLPSLILGMGAWVCEAAILVNLVRAQGTLFTLSDSILLLLILNLAISIPISVANLGTFEAAIVWGLSLYDVPIGTALAIATVHHVVQWIALALWVSFSFRAKERRPD